MYTFCTAIVPRAWRPETDGFWRRSDQIPDRECIPRGFPRNLLFVRGVGREKLREDPNGDDGGKASCVACLSLDLQGDWRTCRETKTRALCLATWSDPMFIFVYELFSLAPVASRSRVRTYECISWPRQHSTRWLLLSAVFDPRDGRKSESPRAYKGNR